MVRIFSFFLFTCLFFQASAQEIPDSLLAGQFDNALQQVVLVKNEGTLIPLQRLDTLRIAYLPMGFDTIRYQDKARIEGLELQQMLQKYTRVDVLKPPKTADAAVAGKWLSEQGGKYNFYILGLKDYGLFGKEATAYQDYAAIISEVIDRYRTVVVIVGRGVALRAAPSLQNAEAILSLASNGLYVQSVAAQIVFGGVGALGKLPVALSDEFPAGAGLSSPWGRRLAYVPPAKAGMNAQLLRDSIKAIVEEGIRAGAYPGAQVLVARHGQVVYHEAFGYHTYDEIEPVTTDDIYDFASVTKVTGPLPAVMKLYGEGRFDPDAPLKKYVRGFGFSNKAKLTYRDMLTHQARLRAWIPFWQGALKSNARYPWHKDWVATTVNDGDFRGRTFQRDSSDRYSIRITEDLWLHKNYKKRIFRAIRKSPLNEKPGYVYSDMSFYLLPEAIAGITGSDYEAYLKRNFYHRLGAMTITYNPLRYFPMSRIVPTERDTFFRLQQIHGTVHDEGAIMMGGVSGHAGLFGAANDLAKVFQMYLNYGSYGGEQLIAEKALKEFSRCQYCEEGNYRGIGFDKPLIEYDPERSSVAESAGPTSFGHSGYTGTFVWVDPESGLLYIFFSNRVYPSRLRRELYERAIRPRIHQVLYDAIEK